MRVQINFGKDDLLDWDGDSSVTGKIGTDIIDGKCTWFAVKFLSVFRPELCEAFIVNLF